MFKSRFKGGSKGKQVFDYQLDFDLIYACIKRYYNIDLTVDDLDWWKFTTILEDILHTDTSLAKRVELRGKKIPKKTKNNGEYIRSLQDLKAKYRLKGNVQEKQVQTGLKGLFDFLKGKAKEG